MAATRSERWAQGTARRRCPGPDRSRRSRLALPLLLGPRARQPGSFGAYGRGADGVAEGETGRRREPELVVLLDLEVDAVVPQHLQVAAAEAFHEPGAHVLRPDGTHLVRRVDRPEVDQDGLTRGADRAQCREPL